MFCCSYSTRDANADLTCTSRDCSLPSQDVHSFEVEEQTRKGSVHCSASNKPSRERGLTLESVLGMSQHIFGLMKDRVKDRKATEGCTASHPNIHSPSQQQDSDFRYKRDAAEHLTPDATTVGSSDYTLGTMQHPSSLSFLQFDHSQASNVDRDERQHFPRNVAEGTIPDASKFVYSHLPMSNEPQGHRSYQLQAAADTNALTAEVLLPHEVQWLDSWAHGSEPADVDLRNYRRQC